MDDISNRTLALLLVTAIVVSLGFTVYSLNNLGAGATGRATTQQGNVTLNVESSVSIILRADNINFGTGYVNGSCNFPIATNNATLTAGLTHTNLNNCWTNRTAQPTSLRLENDGNRNASITIRGPNARQFFGNYAGSNPYNFTFRSRDSETGSCNSGLQATYMSFQAAPTTVCSRLLFDPSSSDELAIDIQVVIPSDIPPGTYQNSTIEFTATQAT
jgi:hypothetical protein